MHCYKMRAVRVCLQHLSCHSLEVCGPRELAFFPGTARGSVVPGFRYETEAGAAALPLRFVSCSGQHLQVRRTIH